MALVLSFAIWHLANISIVRTESFVVHLNVVVPEGLELSQAGSDRMVKLTLEGTPRAIEEYRSTASRTVTRILDRKDVTFADSDTTSVTVTLTAADLALPRELELAPPPGVSFAITRVATKKLPVVLQFKNAEGVGVDTQASRAEPPFVDVTGPSSVMAEAPHILTTPIDLQNRTGTFEKYFVGLQQKLNDVPVRCDKLVTAHVVIRAAPVERVLENVPVTVGDLPGTHYSYALIDSLARIDVSVRGEAKKVNALTNDDVLLWADMRAVDKAAAVRQKTPIHVQLRCLLPPGVELAGGLPDIKVEIKSRLPEPTLPAQ